MADTSQLGRCAREDCWPTSGTCCTSSATATMTWSPIKDRLPWKVTAAERIWWRPSSWPTCSTKHARPRGWSCSTPARPASRAPGICSPARPLRWFEAESTRWPRCSSPSATPPRSPSHAASIPRSPLAAVSTTPAAAVGFRCSAKRAASNGSPRCCTCRGETTQLFSVATSEREGHHHDKPPEHGRQANTGAARGRLHRHRPDRPYRWPDSRRCTCRPAPNFEPSATPPRLDCSMTCSASTPTTATLRCYVTTPFADATSPTGISEPSTRRRPGIGTPLPGSTNRSSNLQPGHPEAAIRREQCEHAQRIVDLQDELRIHAGSGNWQARRRRQRRTRSTRPSGR